jgi:hypothetical protein
MPAERKQGIGAVFWVTFILFGLLILIGLFIWMVRKQGPMPTNPERRNGAVGTAPLNAANLALTRDLTIVSHN